MYVRLVIPIQLSICKYIHYGMAAMSIDVHMTNIQGLLLNITVL